MTKHTLRIMDKTGDTAVAWAPGNETEEAEAKAQFDRLVKSSYLMFSAPADKAEKPTQIRKFDPTAQEIIAVPRYQGG